MQHLEPSATRAGADLLKQSLPVEWLRALLDSQMGLVIVYRPLNNEAETTEEIFQLEVVYCNEEAVGLASLYNEFLVVEPVVSTPSAANGKKETLRHYLLAVWQAGEKLQGRFFHPATGRYYRIVCTKVAQELLAVANDITDEVKDRLQVERLAQQLHTIISTSQSGVHIFKPVFDERGELVDFRMMMVNKIIGDYIGQTVETLTGALASTYFPAYMTNGLFDIYKDCYLNGTRSQFDFHYEDGYDVFFNLLVVRLEDEVLVTLTDHTPLKRAQRELEASVAELKRSNASLEQFAHAASHDLQEPLRKIIVYTEKLLDEHTADMDDTGYGYLERIRTAGKRMHRLVQDLLVFAEVGANKNAVEEVNLDKIVDEVVNDLEVAIAEREASIQKDTLGTHRGDSLHLQQLFQNLISNSLKYAKPGVPPEISIGCQLVAGAETGLPLGEQEGQKQFRLIEVVDNGQGFSPDDAGQIFKIFQRLPQHKQEQSGTGIGLAIVQRVVENHRGYITAEGRPGEGATFRIYLPVG